MNKGRLISEGQKLINKVREVEEIPSEEVMRSWKRVMDAAGKRRSLRKRLFVYGGSVAATLLVLITLLFIYQKDTLPESVALSADLLEQMEVDPSQEEVLLLAYDEVIRLEDDSQLTYDEEGKVHLNDIREKGESFYQEAKTAQGDPEEKLNQIIVPKGKRMNVTLSDGTKVHINSGSRMIYPSTFYKNQREILVEGEVFLDVAKDPERPFIVKTSGMDVRVLGTKFNVTSYRESPHSTVVLVEGSVEVQSRNETSETHILEPNQAIRFNGTETFIEEVDVYEYICWIDNIMLLNKQPVGKVLDRLARSYGRSIVYDPALQQIPISGKLDLKEELTESIEIICLSLSLNYETDASNNIVLTLK